MEKTGTSEAGKPITKNDLYFLNDTGSELSSSNSEDNGNSLHYLLQHQKAKQELQQKAAMIAAQAKAANLHQLEESLGNQDTQSLLISNKEILSQMDPSLLNQLYETTGVKMVLPQRDQLHKRLQSVQNFVENFCIKPIQKESRNAINNAKTEEKKVLAQSQARQAAKLTQDFQEASALGQMLAPKPKPSNPQQVVNQASEQNQQAGSHENNDLNQCDCGAQAKFFQLQSGKHVCESCILTEIYAEESYEDVYLKVLNKMQNIMRLRMKQLQSYKADYAKRQNQVNEAKAAARATEEQQSAKPEQNPSPSPPEEQKKPNEADALEETKQAEPAFPQKKLSWFHRIQTDGKSRAYQDKDKFQQKKQAAKIEPSSEQAATQNEARQSQTNPSSVKENEAIPQSQPKPQPRQQVMHQHVKQEQVMTQQANLMYDLLHIEIEKIRRKSIAQIQQKFSRLAAQQNAFQPQQQTTAQIQSSTQSLQPTLGGRQTSQEKAELSHPNRN